jgi:6-pyruvoyltetrahydropterin/6-carboxytetrahydropterin synthase
MIKTTVTKIFKFEMAHQLTDSYSKECQEIHGHGYTAEITFEGPVDPVTGMVMDFKQLKEIVQPIIDSFDHKFFTKESYGMNPTAENMANDIFWKIREKTLLIRQVRLWETDTGYVTVGY